MFAVNGEWIVNGLLGMVIGLHEYCAFLYLEYGKHFAWSKITLPHFVKDMSSESEGG